MVVRTTTTKSDDIDGTPAAETVRFQLDGSSFEIDLSPRNAEALRGALAEFVLHARRRDDTGRDHRGRPMSRVTPVVRAPAPPASAADLVAIRIWATDNGFRIASRGRIPDHVRAHYAAAHREARRAATRSRQPA
ncbi:histone-like nucleoid-structuring protein Lsr2 [Nakamurella endophytica]|nr:Lsr2 family protein [Nakamurella endophytica]